MKIISYIFLFTVIICFQFAEAQNTEVTDSLLNLVNNSKTPDTTKIKAYNDLGNQYASANSTQAKRYIRKALSLSKETERPRGEAGAYNTMGIVFYYEKAYDSAEIYFKKALKINEELSHLWGQASALNQIGVIQMMRDHYDEAIQSYKDSKAIFIELKDTLAMAKATENIGLSYMKMGYYQKSIDYVYEAMDIYEQMNSLENISRCYLRIARIYKSQKDFQNALKAYLMVLEAGNEQGNQYQNGFALEGIGSCYLGLKDYQNALKYYRLSINNKDQYANKKVKVPTHIGMGNVYLAIKDYQKALEQYHLASKNIPDNGDENYKAMVRIQMANAYLQLDKLNEAKDLSIEGLSMAKQIGNLEREKEALECISLIEEKNGNARTSLQYLKKYLAIKDSTENLERKKQIRELQTIFETEKKEAALALQEEEIKTLNQKVEISNLKKGLYAGGMFSFIAISGLIFFGYRQRMKKNKIEREKQEAIYQQEIDHKKKELASQTLHLVQKNTFIQELRENLERFKNDPELFKVEFRRLVMLLKKQSSDDKDWEVFKSYFVEVNNDFDKKLQSVYPEISEKETRLAALLKMNLSTKEIAAMLNVLPDSILKSKYRLKQKLKLGKETDLYQYLSTL